MAPRKVISVVDGRELSASAQARYVGHSYAMLNSIAWRHLPHPFRRFLERIEIQHMHRGCCENGKLVVTYDQFVKWGTRRGSIKLMIETTVALGFLKVTKYGGSNENDGRFPSTYALTYVKNLGRDAAEPTNEWMEIKDAGEVRRIMKRVAAEIERENEENRAKRAAKPKAANDDKTVKKGITRG
jgi:hypothetical protein